MINDPEHMEKLARQAVKKLQSAGHMAFWAGGCVRDILMNKTPKDYDIATSALPEDVQTLFPESAAVGKTFGVIRAPIEDCFFEIATFRKDHCYQDGRRPEEVSFTDPETDSARRDFTINAIFYDPATDVFHDYQNGHADIKKRIIRCVGNPDERFKEDFLRMLRAVRFAGTLGFSIEPETARAIKQNAQLISRISMERVQEELTRIFTESLKPGDSLVMLDQLGLLDVILPDVSKTKGQTQPPEFHPEGDVFEHTVLMLNMMQNPDITLAYAVLLHDIGKPLTARDVGDRIRFDNHAEEGSELAKTILRKLRLSNEHIDGITYCIHNHMRFKDVQKMKTSTLRKMIGAPTFPVELELHKLDCLASHGSIENYEFLKNIQKQFENDQPLPPRWITGDDMLKLGISEGPELGAWLKTAYDAQLEDQFKNREELLAWLTAQVEKQNQK